MDVHDTHSIADVKGLISGKIVGFLPRQQRLIFEGTELNDADTLGDYHLRNGDLLLILRRAQMPAITRALWRIIDAVRDMERAVLAVREYEETLDTIVDEHGR